MKLSILFLLFIFYAILGWIVEMIYCYISSGKIINRGFLIGPYCPIYGYGALLITLLLTPYQKDPVVLFVMSIAICSILEYFTSFIMEKIFNTRWWDYSKRKFNINGRICLETMIPFGILGSIMAYFINPILFNVLSKLEINTLNMFAFIIFIIFLMDNVISFVIISNLKNITNEIRGDSTEKITKEVRKIVLNKGAKLYQRIVKAFPSFKVIRKK